MIREQDIEVLICVDGRPAQYRRFVVNREHSFSDHHYVAKSHGLICPQCRRQWATLKFTDDALVWPVAQFCENHPIPDEWMPVPGSILNEEGWGVIDDSLLAVLPDELVVREFHLHIKALT